MDPNYEVFQVKEKFGSLRYYFGTKSTDLKEFMMWKVSEKYMFLSEKTCEITGKAGKLMFKQGLYKTLAEEYEKDGWKLVDGVSADEIFGVVPPEWPRNTEKHHAEESWKYAGWVRGEMLYTNTALSVATRREDTGQRRRIVLPVLGAYVHKQKK